MSQIHTSKPPTRVLILIPSTYFFYINQSLALREAFARRGIDSYVLIDKIDDNAMLAILSGYRPDFVFSVNAFKRPVMENFPDIRHVRWIQDNQYGEIDNRRQTDNPLSDICYTATQRCLADLHIRARHHTGTLRFAGEPTRLGPSTDVSAVFSLVAYIPPANIFDATFTAASGKQFTGWDFFDYFSNLQQDSLDTQPEMSDQITEVFLNFYGLSAKDAPEDILRVFREDYVRGINRCRFVRKILSLGVGCSLFGTPEWTTWPEFAPHFRGPLPTIESNVAVYRSTCLNLHNGGTLSHPRVFDCMAAYGGPILANRGFVETALDLEPGTHYIEYDLADFEPQARELIADPERCRRISRNAYEHVCRHHTWDHRVAQILGDLDR